MYVQTVLTVDSGFLTHSVHTCLSRECTEATVTWYSISPLFAPPGAGNGASQNNGDTYRLQTAVTVTVVGACQCCIELSSVSSVYSTWRVGVQRAHGFVNTGINECLNIRPRINERMPKQK